MNDTDDRNRDVPQSGESEEESTEETPTSGQDRTTEPEDPLLDVVLTPITDTLEEVVSVENTPPNHVRTESGRSRRGEESGPNRSAHETDSKLLGGDIPDDDYHIDTERTTDELVVSAELPDVTAEELFVGIDKETQSLVVAVDDAIIAQEFYPWEAIDASSTRFDPPDLHVRLEPATDAGST